jgi:6-phosphogluconolactonase
MIAATFENVRIARLPASEPGASIHWIIGSRKSGDFRYGFWEHPTMTTTARFRHWLLAFLVAGLAASILPQTTLHAAEGNEDSLTVYIGTYTRKGGSKGIYRLELDTSSGELTPVGEPAETENPSFLAIHPNGKLLFAVNELSKYEGKNSGAVTSFTIDLKTGALTRVNQQPSLGGAPCYIVVDKAGRHVLLANYSGGSVAVLPFNEKGKLSPASSFVQHEGSSVLPRQKGPHGHSINLDAAGKFAFAADLGLDKILVYKYDENKGTLTPNDPAFVKVAPGSGPRHFDFHPSGRFAYAINEIARTVTAFAYDAERGVLSPLQTISTVPQGFESGSTAHVQVHPSGKFVYGSNRGHDSIAIFSVDPKSGKLTAVGHQSTGGKTPRNFGIDPSGKFLLAANQSTDNVVVFRIDQETGKLEPTGHEIEVPAPVCVKFLK